MIDAMYVIDCPGVSRFGFHSLSKAKEWARRLARVNRVTLDVTDCRGYAVYRAYYNIARGTVRGGNL